jgi:hypothetical protein
VTSHKAAAESARKVAEDNEANLRKQALGDKNKVKIDPCHVRPGFLTVDHG